MEIYLYKKRGDTVNLIDKLKTASESLTFGEKILGGLQAALFGMVVVFSILLCIMIAIYILEKIAGGSKKAPAKAISAEETTMDKEEKEEVLEDYGELVAVISAAIAASLNTSTHNIVVKNITRTTDHTPVWSRISRIEQLRN